MFQTSISWLAIEMTGQKINEKWKCIAKLFSRDEDQTKKQLSQLDWRPRYNWQSLKTFYLRQFKGTLCPRLMEQEESFSRQFFSLEQNVFFSVFSFYSGICFRSNKVIAPRFRNENIKKASIYSDIDKMLILNSNFPFLIYAILLFFDIIDNLQHLPIFIDVTTLELLYFTTK